MIRMFPLVSVFVLCVSVASAQTVTRRIELGALNMPGIIDAQPIDDDGDTATEAWLLERVIDFVRHFQLVTVDAGRPCFEAPFAPRGAATMAILTKTLEWNQGRQMLRIVFVAPWWTVVPEGNEAGNIVDLIRLDRTLCR